MGDTEESDYVAQGDTEELYYVGTQESDSLALLSLRPLFFGGCPELVDCLGATDLSKSGSSWPSLSPPPSDNPPTSSSLVS